MRPLIFDFDETLVSRDSGHVPFPQTRDILQHLYSEGYPMYIASFNPFVEDILWRLDLYQYFQGIADLVSITSKPAIVLQLAVKYQIDLTQSRFFDDDPRNVRECLAINLHTTKVDPLIGVTWAQVAAALYF